MATALAAQNRQASSPNGRKIHGVARTARPVSTSAPQKPVPYQPPPFPALSPEAIAPSPPRVTYESGQLTIIAKNSEISDILSLLSERTGAEIDYPRGVVHERIWSEFGPGPARKVLASLLSGMGLDYAIQASDIDPRGIRRVILRAQTQLDAGRVPDQENPTSLEPGPTPEAETVNLQPTPAESQPSADTRESTASEQQTFTEEMPAEFRTLLETGHSFGAKYIPLDIVINAHKSFAEDPRVAAFAGQPVGDNGRGTDIRVNDNNGVLLRVWIVAQDKLHLSLVGSCIVPTTAITLLPILCPCSSNQTLTN